MRKLTFTLLSLFAGYAAVNAQLTNGDLETWTSNQWSTTPSGSGNTYLEPGTGTDRSLHFLRGLNELNDLPFPLTIPRSCFRSDTAHGGQYSARVVSQQFSTYFIPGFLGTGDINIAAQTLYLGRPYTSRPNSFEAWYQYAPVNGDSAKFEVYFTKNSVVIGSGEQVITSAANSWSHVGFNINWTDTVSPDTVVIIAAASGGYNLADFLQSSGQPGSMLWVDDMTLNAGFIGIEQEYTNNKVSIYPNPSTGIYNISTAGLAADLKVFVYDITGKQMLAGVMNGNNLMIDMTAFPAGVYGLVIQDNMNLIHRSRIVKH